MRPDILKKVIRHGKNLNAIFHTPFDAVTLCRKVRRLEATAHALATNYCNGVVQLTEFDIEEAKILDLLDAILGFKYHHVPVFVNMDARGYSLKIHSDYFAQVNNAIIEKDWGGYGIIAPDLS